MRKCIPKIVELHGYADDHALKISFLGGCRDSELSTTRLLEKSLSQVKTWMEHNRLKMNDSKTGFIQFGSAKQLCESVTQTLSVNKCEISKVNVTKYLGVYLDKNLTMKSHIQSKCRSAVANYRRIASIRKYLTIDACKQIVHGLIISHLDYCNSLLYGLPDCEIKKLQRIQNMAAKLVLNKNRLDSSTACLKELHWLPVTLRIQFKILTLVWKCLNGQPPDYLTDMLKLRTSKHVLRSSAKAILLIPKTHCKSFGDRSFAVAGPRLWSDLPSDIQFAPTLQVFRTKLKTWLFSM